MSNAIAFDGINSLVLQCGTSLSTAATISTTLYGLSNTQSYNLISYIANDRTGGVSNYKITVDSVNVLSATNISNTAFTKIISNPWLATQAIATVTLTNDNTTNLLNTTIVNYISLTPNTTSTNTLPPEQNTFYINNNYFASTNSIYLFDPFAVGFTLEFWANFQSFTNVSSGTGGGSIPGLFGLSVDTASTTLPLPRFCFGITTAGKLCAYWNTNNSNGNGLIGNTILAIGTWYHIAISCDKTILRIYLNGILDNSAGITTPLSTNTGSYLTIGQVGGSYFNNAYLSNLRLIYGAALYTNTNGFFVPTSPLTASPVGLGAGKCILLLRSPGSSANISVLNNVATLANGGTVSSSGNYIIHTFTTTGTSTFILYNNTVCDILVVGGGGGGGYNCGSGGGGGNVLYFSQQFLTSGSYTITVGAGGAGGTSANGTAGSSSQFGTFTPASGGTAGLGAQTNASGGAGAGGPGYNSSYNAGGNGGTGLSNSISGILRYYGGGGGGSANYSLAAQTYTGYGGIGGGADGAAAKSTAGNNALSNTGGGGGGGGNSNAANGGAGGSGIVIVRYIANGYTLSNQITAPTFPLDTLSAVGLANLKGAFSLQRLLTSYTGPVINIQRNSDSSKADFYSDAYTNLGTWINGSWISIFNWLKSATGTVVFWYDQSNRGQMLSSINITGPTIYLGGSVPGLYFNGSQSLQVVPGILATGQSQYTYFAIWNQTVSGNCSVCEHNSATLISNQRSALLAFGGNYGFNGENNDNNALVSETLNTRYNSVMRINNSVSSNITIKSNGIDYTGASGNNTTLNLNNAGFTVGRKFSVNGEFMSGYIYTVCVFGVNLSNSDALILGVL
jgi:hypothetical protein